MNIKGLSELLDKKQQNGNVGDEEFLDLMKTLFDCVNQSRDVIFAAVSEKDFVRSCRMVKEAVLATAISQGNGSMAYLSNQAGELDGILDTYLLSMLGLLMQDEII